MKRMIRKFLSYVQEYEDFDCNSMVFNDVLYSVHAHENLFSFVTCGFVAAKHGLAVPEQEVHEVHYPDLFFIRSRI